MESRHCGQDKRIFFCPVHNASTQCSLQAFGIRCMKWIKTHMFSVSFDRVALKLGSRTVHTAMQA